AILMASPSEEKVEKAAELLGKIIKEKAQEVGKIKVMGPTKAWLSKANDIYRRILYLKDKEDRNLKDMIKYVDGYIRYSEYMKEISIQFDYDPMNSY
ncbi:MAG: hypothetical protein RR056_04365, partial [Acetivibrio sp.]